jgi:hypothetical protein
MADHPGCVAHAGFDGETGAQAHCLAGGAGSDGQAGVARMKTAGHGCRRTWREDLHCFFLAAWLLGLRFLYFMLFYFSFNLLWFFRIFSNL